jgi:hypothetical protein
LSAVRGLRKIAGPGCTRQALERILRRVTWHVIKIPFAGFVAVKA